MNFSVSFYLNIIIHTLSEFRSSNRPEEYITFGHTTTHRDLLQGVVKEKFATIHVEMHPLTQVVLPILNRLLIFFKQQSKAVFCYEQKSTLLSNQ